MRQLVLLNSSITTVILTQMKTAISIPDKVFDAAEKVAKKLGMSRSELYVNAVREYLERHGRDDVTDRLNEVYSSPEADSGVDSGLAAMQYKSLPQEEW